MLKLGSKEPTNHRAALRASPPMAAQFSNISYLKQFKPKKMGAFYKFLIFNFLKGLTHLAFSGVQ